MSAMMPMTSGPPPEPIQGTAITPYQAYGTSGPVASYPLRPASPRSPVRGREPPPPSAYVAPPPPGTPGRLGPWDRGDAAYGVGQPGYRKGDSSRKRWRDCQLWFALFKDEKATKDDFNQNWPLNELDVDDEDEPMPSRPSSEDGQAPCAYYDADWAMPVVDDWTYARVRNAVQERWLAFAHGDAPWRADRVYVFGPEGEVGERSMSIFAGRRRVEMWKEALEPLGMQLVQKIGIELSNGPSLA